MMISSKILLVRAFEQKPKAIVVCTPSNPTGKVLTRDELLCILQLAEDHMPS